MPFTTGELARQFMIETIECGTYLPEHADAFGAVLSELREPVIPAASEAVHLPRQRIGSVKVAVAITDIRACAPKPAAEPGEPRDQVVKYRTRQMKISTHRYPCPDCVTKSLRRIANRDEMRPRNTAAFGRQAINS